jgi:hypothetical protein
LIAPVFLDSDPPNTATTTGSKVRIMMTDGRRLDLDPVNSPPVARVVVGLHLISLCSHYVGAARSIVLAPTPGRGDMDFSAYRISRRVYKCTTREIDGYHRMCSRFVSAENQYPVVPSNDLVP